MSGSTPNTAADEPLHVAVGILTDGNKVFITRRSRHSHQGGKWEFPGGKIEPGEDTLSALKRELMEELGIEVVTAEPSMQIRHAYRERHVLLDVWRILDYRGTPIGREGQETRWTALPDLMRLEFPAADLPILRRLWLPPLYLITDSRRFGKSEFLAPLERALQSGARLVQLREPHMPPEEYRDYARRIASLCHRHEAKLLLNAEPEWVLACEADGVHLNSRRLMQCRERPLDDRYWVAASCHNVEELRQAKRLAVDFAVLSPVADTASHPDATPIGWNKFAQWRAGANLPVYALGGMQVQDLDRARRHGAQGLAMVSEIWGARSIEQTVGSLAAV
ncbi:MAG TPA: Nudix family hydrolase [Candidatus Methylomirabilis sp.]|nr:Nudix family hydrolase [Candidatus Methylomirabilis sp.]